MGEVMLKRRHVVAELLKARGESAVVCGLGSPTYDVAAESPSERNFYLWGAMGGAAMMGLGLALAQPELQVIVITGDGEAMMGMGSLATIGCARPGNLTIVVLDNERYGETGMQHSHLGMGVDLCAVASGCGLKRSRLVKTEEELNSVSGELSEIEFLQVKVDPESPSRVMPSRDAVENKIDFRRALGVVE